MAGYPIHLNEAISEQSPKRKSRRGYLARVCCKEVAMRWRHVRALGYSLVATPHAPSCSAAIWASLAPTTNVSTADENFAAGAAKATTSACPEPAASSRLHRLVDEHLYLWHPKTLRPDHLASRQTSNTSSPLRLTRPLAGADQTPPARPKSTCRPRAANQT